jgi:hypothetical protein
VEEQRDGNQRQDGQDGGHGGQVERHAELGNGSEDAGTPGLVGETEGAVRAIKVSLAVQEVEAGPPPFGSSDEREAAA